jgi:hypothetical protein
LIRTTALVIKAIQSVVDLVQTNRHYSLLYEKVMGFVYHHNKLYT